MRNVIPGRKRTIKMYSNVPYICIANGKTTSMELQIPLFIEGGVSSIGVLLLVTFHV